MRRYGKETKLLEELGKLPSDLPIFADVLSSGPLQCRGIVMSARVRDLLAARPRAGGCYSASGRAADRRAGDAASGAPCPSLQALNMPSISPRIRAPCSARAADFGLDWRRRPADDHNRPAFGRRVTGWIETGCIAAIWLGTPCTSWAGALPGSLRSADHIRGLPDFTMTERERERERESERERERERERFDLICSSGKTCKPSQQRPGGRSVSIHEGLPTHSNPPGMPGG